MRNWHLIFFCAMYIHLGVATENGPNIIYVHLGSHIPSYLYVALEQARRFNTDIEISLLGNESAIRASGYDFSSFRIKTVTCESLEMSNYHQDFLKSTSLDINFREGFWIKATERFFYLHEYITLYRLQDVVHLESDNMLYANIKEMLIPLSCYMGIGAVFDCDNRCIPSFVFIKDADAIQDLVKFISQRANQGYDDMSILALYWQQNPCRISPLPLIMPDYFVYHSPTNLLGRRAADKTVYHNNFDLFNSIFDGAALGQYLGGIDPRNGVSKAGFINESCVFNPSNLAFKWIRDDQGRKVPYVSFNKRDYKINNLHIHSKQLDKFIS